MNYSVRRIMRLYAQKKRIERLEKLTIFSDGLMTRERSKLGSYQH
jgi:hypothetical protein